MTGDNETEPKLHIWIDADACPRTIKEIVFKTSKRLKLRVTLVANQGMYSPSSELIEVVTVPHGADVADDKFVSLVQNNDLVITEIFHWRLVWLKKELSQLGHGVSYLTQTLFKAGWRLAISWSNFAPPAWKHLGPNQLIPKIHRRLPTS